MWCLPWPGRQQPAPNFPKLAGQGERYLDQADARHQEGKRTVLEMTGLLTNLSDQDLAISPPTSPARKAVSALLIRNWSHVARSVPRRQPGKRHARLHRLPLA
jgi:hypothetical protein